MSFPITVAVTRPDGTTEQVRVGTATQNGEGFAVTLGQLTIGKQADPPAARGSVTRPAAPQNGSSGPVLPNYGRTAGQPIRGASLGDLEFYANGARRSIADPQKERWREKETALLAAIEAELQRQQGGGGGGSEQGDPGPGDSEDIPFRSPPGRGTKEVGGHAYRRAVWRTF